MTIIKSKKLRDSAKGQECTLRIPGICNFNPETVVLAHLPDESHGMSRKSDDISACFSCSSCHDLLDGRGGPQIGKSEKEWYMRRAQTRTLRKWLEMGLITVKGVR